MFTVSTAFNMKKRLPYPRLLVPLLRAWIPLFLFVIVLFSLWILNPLMPNSALSQETPPNNTPSAKEISKSVYKPGIANPAGEPYTKMIVIARTKEEEMNWLEENFGGDEYIKFVVYTADNVTAEHHPPKNKGHETMIYLSYIIDYYHKLSDVNIFLHAHRHGWHNNELLGQDAVQIISRLSAERVQREGYMNMRCQWEPGCPSWMHPGVVEEDPYKQEETLLAKSWSEIFPLDPIPHVLAQPCCAQFAVSRDRIQALPLSRYVFCRDWLLRTRLPDYISGRVWEYVWQFVFTGNNVVCPKEHVCNCDGFGVCFGGEEEYNAYYEKRNERRRLEDELRRWRGLIENKMMEEGKPGWEEVETPEVGKDKELQELIDGLNIWCDQKLEEAKQHGDVAMNRALEAGRPWKDGDGF
jgi:hypothetical protein